MTDKQKANIRKNNMKLYPIYQMVGGDFMFFYAIKVLFLMQVKDIGASDIVFLSTLYAVFAIILRIPALFVMEKMGKKNAMILGNGINIVFVLIIIFCTGYEQLIIAQLISAFSDALRGTAGSGLLKESVPKSKKGGEIYTRIEGKGYSKYAYFQAFSDVSSGILYDLNPYIPLVFCLISVILSTIISTKFVDIKGNVDEKIEQKNIKQTVNDILSGFKFMFNSRRLKALFLMVAAIWGIFSFTSNYMTTLFEDMQCTATFIGVISAIQCIAKGIASKKEKKFHKAYRNKSLTVMGELLCIFLIVAGVTSIINIPFIVQILIIAIVFIALESLKGVYQIITKRYMNNFTDKDIYVKIYSANGISANVAAMIGSSLASLALSITNIRYATVMMGIIFIFIIIGVSKYMKPRVGLKPEQYNEKDIIIKE